MNAEQKRGIKIVVCLSLMLVFLLTWAFTTIITAVEMTLAEDEKAQAAQQADGVAIGASCKLLGMNVIVNHVYQYPTGSVDVITGSLRVIKVKRTLLKQCSS